jgi:hypothetical protein
MTALGGFLTISGAVFCCGALFIFIMCALVVWYWRNNPNQKVSATAPEPPVQATIEHPTAATVAPVAPAPTAPSDSAPPSADA